MNANNNSDAADEDRLNNRRIRQQTKHFDNFESEEIRAALKIDKLSCLTVPSQVFMLYSARLNLAHYQKQQLQDARSRTIV
jgi:hypothetical protein